MEYKNIFGFRNEWNWKTISLFCFLAVFPNILGLVHIDVFGFRIHFFQYLVFLAAIVYGPVGGAVSGAFGSVYTATMLHNPYIIAGNIFLGFLVGLFVRHKFHIVLAAILAYLAQMPWLWYSDIYLAGMPVAVVQKIVVALLVSDVIMALAAGYSYKPVKALISL